MEKQYTVGVIGYGHIFHHGHWLEGLSQIPDRVRVKYIYDEDPERARLGAETTGAQAVSDSAAIYDDPEVDIVSVATPPFARLPYVERACAAGKHLMLEKPMARTLEDALRIHQLCMQADIATQVLFARAADTIHQMVLQTVRSGAIGEVRAFAHQNYTGPYGWVPLDHWMHTMEKSGGPIFDFSVHYLDLARACIGSEAASVTYVGSDLTKRVKSDDHAVTTVTFDNGALAEISKSWAFPPPAADTVFHHTVFVIGTEGTIYLKDGYKVVNASGTSPIVVAPDALPGRAQAYLNLIEAIEGRGEAYATVTDGLRATEILDAALRSRESGCREQVTRNAV